MTSRRTFIKAAGAAALSGAVAGCTGDSGGTNGTAGDTAGTETGTMATGADGTTTDSAGGNETAGAGGAVSGTVLEERTSDGLEIVDHEYVTEGGAQRVRGTVENTGETTYGYVEIHVDPYDSEETQLGRFKTDSQESTDRLAPGSAWEFTVEFETENEVARYDVWATGTTGDDAGNGSADGNETAGTDDAVSGTVLEEQTAEALEVVDHEYVVEGGDQRVRGTVENTGDATYDYVEVHVDPYDSEETQLGRFKTDSQESIDRLAPGSAWEFSVGFETESEVARYDVWATGRTGDDAGNDSGN
jgi:hypothetical protein